MEIPPTIVNTAFVPPQERFALWRDALSTTHEAKLPEYFDPTNFNGVARGWSLGQSILIETKTTAQQLVRTPRLIRADRVDHYLIRLQQHGRWIGEIDGRTVEAWPGDVIVLDMARPTAAHHADTTNINILVPRDALDAVMPPFNIHGLVLKGGMANLIGSHLTTLLANMECVRRNHADKIADATCRLIAACLAPSRDTMACAGSMLHELRVAQIRRYIDSHLCSPTLTPESICKALRISRSTLYATCKPLGGVAAFIQRRRLERIYTILTDPRDCRRISEIAYQHGFVNGAHFSRTFRRAFGCSPRDVREMPAIQPSGNGRRETTTPGVTDNWVRQLSR